jgi:cellulose synthase/poly-beta-1,6-N-acetylglucosamine synthase-like glycosyltransferase
LEPIIVGLFLAGTAVQLICWLGLFGNLAARPVEPAVETLVDQSKEGVPPVSVVICARNEAKYLQAHLHRILNQTYRSFEVIVVVHKSADNSLNILSYLQRRHPHLVVVPCEDGRQGKKIPLAAGIARASHPYILVTDADCRPVGDRWIAGMMSGFDQQTDIVLGVAPYADAGRDTGWTVRMLNLFIRYEAWYTAVQYLSFALAGMPYMGVGRNMAYRKELLERRAEIKGAHLVSGDDDLFVNAVARKGRVAVRIHPDTFMYSDAKRRVSAYIRQKSRHYSTGKYYKFSHRFFLGALTMSHLLHYLLGGSLLTSEISIMFAVWGYAVRISVVMIIGTSLMHKLRHRRMWYWIPLLDLFLVPYYFLFAPATLMNNDTQRWN